MTTPILSAWRLQSGAPVRDYRPAVPQPDGSVYVPANRPHPDSRVLRREPARRMGGYWPGDGPYVPLRVVEPTRTVGYILDGHFQPVDQARAYATRELGEADGPAYLRALPEVEVI